MTGPEHYREAEELLDSARDNFNEGDEQRAMYLAALAQVHATLAHTAATALGNCNDMQVVDTRAWHAIASEAATETTPR